MNFTKTLRISFLKKGLLLKYYFHFFVPFSSTFVTIPNSINLVLLESNCQVEHHFILFFLKWKKWSWKKLQWVFSTFYLKRLQSGYLAIKSFISFWLRIYNFFHLTIMFRCNIRKYPEKKFFAWCQIRYSEFYIRKIPFRELFVVCRSADFINNNSFSNHIQRLWFNVQ